MSLQLPPSRALDSELCRFIDAYRARYLGFFLDYFEAHRGEVCRGGYFSINSVSGRPYGHSYCYSWTDGRSLGELCVAYSLGLGERRRLRPYIEHLRDALQERYELNGYFPHVVDERTNLAADSELNVRLTPGQSSYSHVFVLCGLWQYELAMGSGDRGGLHAGLLTQLEWALASDRFLEGSVPRPQGERSQGPFMITLGALVDVVETMAALWADEPERVLRAAAPLIALGRRCVAYVLENHHRAEDHALWEVSRDGTGVKNADGVVVTDPGHSIEFTGFASRFAAFLPGDEGAELLSTCRDVFLWAASRGFHPRRDLVYKNVDRDTGQPIPDAAIGDARDVVAPEVYREHFANRSAPARIATFPWWAPWELVAAGSILRRGDTRDAVDGMVLRALRGIFDYYPREAIGGLRCQTIGDGFFQYVDIPPATATLDLMHCHRSMRVFLREVRRDAGEPTDERESGRANSPRLE